MVLQGKLEKELCRNHGIVGSPAIRVYHGDVDMEVHSQLTAERAARRQAEYSERSGRAPKAVKKLRKQMQAAARECRKRVGKPKRECTMHEESTDRIGRELAGRRKRGHAL